MQPKASVRGLPLYKPGKSLEEVKRELGLEDVIKLASNENPFGCSPRVWKALEEIKGEFQYYPEGAAPELREKLAEHLEVDPRRLIFGNGSDEIVQMLARTYLEPGAESVMADFTFPRYDTVTRIEGGVPVVVPLREGVHDLEGMLAAITEKTRLVWICNPNNPTGTIVGQDLLSDFLDRIPPHVLVVLDEAYYEYVTDSTYPDSISLLDYNPQIIILRTFSKIYGLAAFRVGYGIAHPDVIAELERVREPFNVNRLAQKAAAAAVEDEAFVLYCRNQNRMGIKQMTEKFDEWGLSYFPAHGNFILVDTGHPADEVFQHLLHRGVIVRSGVHLGFPEHIRVTVGKKEQNERFLEELHAFLQKRGK
ncbi:MULTISPECIES: histidinol-phosphate transaminase [Laceyella]|jgi:histidinol-phosphate aminotransferase|uniref:Histidinol-phosphate aminotransferase n=1 Tax=Laceyella sediminis TaxID=573074 RepID=A0ABX5EP72_9BACL|nr:histidinol-phosphate transaminase [Laceyella sediminis]MRG27705.1 histidinol-phosphate transaminase [Laceyella tengchongensis]PRZ14362.1 histidinol phosphate aminotransferase [Laceyella sediminis]